MEQKNTDLNIAVFFCQRFDKEQDVNRRPLEKELGNRIKFFPLPCGGRIDSLHLLRAFESGADKVYLITCPKDTCRYLEGNSRAEKRLAYAQKLIEEIGLEPERLELIKTHGSTSITIDSLTRKLLDRDNTVGPSPVRLR